jgi:hypothetical protein
MHPSLPDLQMWLVRPGLFVELFAFKTLVLQQIPALIDVKVVRNGAIVILVVIHVHVGRGGHLFLALQLLAGRLLLLESIL